MKYKKGTYGYINAHKKIEILKTVLMLLLCVATYFLGLKTTGSKNNLLTFVAVLGCLPMAKFAVNAVLFLKAKSCSKEVYEKISEASLEPTFFDLYFTGYKKNFQASALYYKKNTIIIFTEDEKVDDNLFVEHLNGILENIKVTNVTIKIYHDLSDYISRLSELSNLEDDKKDHTFLLENILSVSI